MARFYIRSYENGQVLWVELRGAAAAAAPREVRRRVERTLPSFDPETDPPQLVVLDLSQVVMLAGRAFDAALAAVCEAPALAVIPPADPDWLTAHRAKLPVGTSVFRDRHHALDELELGSQGLPRARPHDKRREPRVQTALWSRLWVDHPTGVRFGRALIANLSRSGACLQRIDVPMEQGELANAVEEGSALTLQVSIGSERGFVRSRVTRVRRSDAPTAATSESGRMLRRSSRTEEAGGAFELGVRFERLDDDLRPAIGQLVAAGAQRSF